MRKSSIRKLAGLLLCFALIFTQAAVVFADDSESTGTDDQSCWTLGQKKNVNGPEEGVQGTNGWYFMYTDQINLGEGNTFDASKIKECTWASKGSMQMKSEGGTYDSMWMPSEYLSDELTGDALHQPNSENPDGTFNNWIMTTDGTLNPDVETTAVTGIYAWEAPETGDYKYTVNYNAGGNHCDLGGTRYYYYKDYYIKDGTPSKKTPEQREGGVAVSVDTADKQLNYAECKAMTEDHDYLYTGNFDGKVSLKKGEKIYFAVDPREVGSYDMANLKITVTTGEDCIWATGDGAVTYEWDDDNNCTAYRKCTTHKGHTQSVTAEGVLTKTIKEPTCTEDGEGVYEAKFNEDGLETQTATRPIAKTGHQVDPYNNIDWDASSGYGDKTKIEWSDDYSKATWYTKCSTCGEWVKVEEVDTTAVPVSGSAADCTHGGEATYKASFYWGWFPVESDPVTVGPLGHSTENAYNNAYADNASELTKFVWSDDNSKCTWQTKCARCDEFVDVETVSTTTGTRAASCTKPGAKTVNASFWGGWVSASKDIEETDPPLGHKWSKWTLKDGKLTRECTVCNEKQELTASLSKTVYTYSGKTKTPSVTVKINNEKQDPSDYTVKYASGRKNVGKYKVTVTPKDDSSAALTLYFKINPKSTSIKSLSKSKKAFTVKWKKLTTQTTGYQIQYGTSSSFKSAKTKTITSNKKYSLKISKLKGGKKYYVRVRTYKKVGSTKYYSDWSSKKSVTTKK